MDRQLIAADLLDLLYLHGLSTGDFREALPALLGPDAQHLAIAPAWLSLDPQCPADVDPARPDVHRSAPRSARQDLCDLGDHHQSSAAPIGALRQDVFIEDHDSGRTVGLAANR